MSHVSNSPRQVTKKEKTGSNCWFWKPHVSQDWQAVELDLLFFPRMFNLPLQNWKIRQHTKFRRSDAATQPWTPEFPRWFNHSLIHDASTHTWLETPKWPADLTPCCFTVWGDLFVTTVFVAFTQENLIVLSSIFLKKPNTCWSYCQFIRHT